VYTWDMSEMMENGNFQVYIWWKCQRWWKIYDFQVYVLDIHMDMDITE
jgi:hypothetical protein